MLIILKAHIAGCGQITIGMRAFFKTKYFLVIFGPQPHVYIMLILTSFLLERYILQNR